MSRASTQFPPPTGNIPQCLDQMRSDAREISKRLLDATMDLTGKNEAKLFEIIDEIKGKLDEAKKVWGD